PRRAPGRPHRPGERQSDPDRRGRRAGRRPELLPHGLARGLRALSRHGAVLRIRLHPGGHRPADVQQSPAGGRRVLSQGGLPYPPLTGIQLMTRAVFLGTGMAVPEQVVTNHDLAARMETSDEWIRPRTGISERRRWVRPGGTGTALALRASRAALEMASLDPGDIDAIVYATSTPDHFAPGNGVFLQEQLGAGLIPALDVRTQCSGFIYALSVADAWIRAGSYRHVLVVGAEVQSTGMDVSTEGRNTAVIFADGAGAAVLGPTEDASRGILGFDIHSQGAHARKLWVDTPGSVYHPRITPGQLAEG